MQLRAVSTNNPAVTRSTPTEPTIQSDDRPPNEFPELARAESEYSAG
jgi:hypothetical protein